jgi:NADH-quinone oxidoreductase subunit L
MLCGAVAIAGVPPFSGFFSKDAILLAAHHHSPWMYWVGVITAGMTAFYVFRAVFLTFYGKDNVSHDAKHHLHESPPVMTIPLIVLAAGAVLAGFLGIPAALNGSNAIHSWLEPVFAGHVGGHAVGVGMAHSAVSHGAATAIAASTAGHNTDLEMILMGVSVLVAIAGIFFAHTMYVRSPAAAAGLARSLGPVYTLVANKFYVDELYEHAIVRPGYAIADKVMYRFVDSGIIDGIVNGLGISARLIGAGMRLMQSGVVRTYAFFMLVGFLYLVYTLVN